MPTFAVELDDGRKFEIEADSQPDESSIHEAISSYQPPEVSKPLSSEGASSFTPDQMAAMTEQLVQSEQQRRAVGAGMEPGTELTQALYGAAVHDIPQAVGGAMETVMKPVEKYGSRFFNTAGRMFVNAVEGPNQILETGDYQPTLAELPVTAPGKSVLPGLEPAADQVGVVPAIRRQLAGLTTPGNLALLPAATESKLLQAAFGASMASAVPPAAERLLQAKTGPEAGEAAVNLAVPTLFAGLIGSHLAKGGAEIPRTVEEQFRQQQPSTTGEQYALESKTEPILRNVQSESRQIPNQVPAEEGRLPANEGGGQEVPQAVTVGEATRALVDNPETAKMAAGGGKVAVTEENVSELAAEPGRKFQHKDGIAYGETLGEADVPRLREKYDAANKATLDATATMMKAMRETSTTTDKAKNEAEINAANAAAVKAGNEAIFYGGALMGATRGKFEYTGTNYELYLKEKAKESKTAPAPEAAYDAAQELQRISRSDEYDPAKLDSLLSLASKDYKTSIYRGAASALEGNPNSLSALHILSKSEISPAEELVGSRKRYEIAKKDQNVAAAEAPQPVEAVGMGAAAPAEFNPVREFVTRNTVDQMNKERHERGEKPIEEHTVISNPETKKAAEDVLDANSGAGEAILHQIETNPDYIPNRVEWGVLAIYRAMLDNSYYRAMKNWQEHVKDGSTDAAAAEMLNVKTLEQQIDRLDKTAGKGGAATRAGQAVQAISIGIDQDYSLSRMLLKAAVDKGSPLTEAESVKILELHEKIDQQRKMIAKLETALRKAQSKVPAGETRTETKAERAEREANEKDYDQAKVDEDHWRQEFLDILDRFQTDQMKWRQRIWKGIKTTASVPINLLSAFDFSAPLRQALQANLSHIGRLPTSPIEASKMLANPLAKMFRAAASENQARLMEKARERRPNALSGLYKAAKLELTPLDNATFTKGEENAHSRLDKWGQTPYRTGNAARTLLTAPFRTVAKGVRISNRAYNTYLNEARADLFDNLTKIEYKDRPPTKEEVQILGNLVNIATGRGKIGPKTQAAGAVLWSPKLIAAHVQALTGQPLWTGLVEGKGLNPKARAIVAKEYVRAIAGGYLLWKASRLFDEKQEDDPKSTDYGKIVRGNTRIDPWGGFQQITTLANRAVTGETTNIEGRTSKTDLGDLLLTFGRNHIRPELGTAWDVADIAMDRVKPGHSQTAGDVAQSLVVPLSIRDLIPLFEEHGMDEAAAIQALNIFGAGVNVYGEKERPR